VLGGWGGWRRVEPISPLFLSGQAPQPGEVQDLQDLHRYVNRLPVPDTGDPYLMRPVSEANSQFLQPSQHSRSRSTAGGGWGGSRLSDLSPGTRPH
jgi:hypothetical protein